MNISPYINKTEGKIVRRLVRDKTHIALDRNISLDYDKINCFREDILINGKKPLDTYNSSLGIVYVLDFNPKGLEVTLSVDHEKRMTILKSLTSRFLIDHALRKHHDLEAYNFTTAKDISSLEIDGVKSEDEAEKLIISLEKIMKIYIESGLEIIDGNSSSGHNTYIPGIYKGAYKYPHLSNLSEIGDFKIPHYYIEGNKLTLYYNN